jgi:hypothetical protein
MLNWYKRRIASVLFKRRLAVDLEAPLVSFTFDDFPRSALHCGGAILKSYGVAGTYYASLGLLGLDSPSGRVCISDDLVTALEEGHELGCHTFSHCDSWDTDGLVFEQSIIQNRAALAEIVPGASFRSFSYPLSTPRPSVKRASAKHFACSRAGGQTFNSGTADLNQLSAYFLEKTKGDIRPVRDVIRRNKESNGWLIFATHDISPQPSPFGCTSEFFEEVVRSSVESGARILPVIGVLDAIRSTRIAGDVAPRGEERADV